MGEENAKASYSSLGPVDKKKGGFTASSFIFVLLALDNMGFVANMVSMVLYFMYVMKFDLAHSANTVTNFMGSTFLLSLIGGFISDTYLSRFTTCLIFGTVEILALVLMTIQAYSKDLHPKPSCMSSCVEGRIAFMLYASLCLLALGSGGVRGALPALGADQFNRKEEAKSLATFFNGLMLSSTIGATIGVTAIVYVSINAAWYWGFFISTIATFVGFAVFAIGKPFYRLQIPGDSPIIRIVQVIVVAIKNRRLPQPGSPQELYEISEKESNYSEEKIAHTDQFRFLDKAAILGKDTKPQQWVVCTVTQVEEVKVLTRMLPILFSTIIMNTCLAQLQTFSVQQGNAMNRHLGSFEVPAPSVPVIPLLFMSILIPIYEFFFVPFARKITNHPSGITQLQRVGVGLVLSAISMAVAGIVEVKRKNQVHKDIKISLFWLSFQYAIFGIADMFTLVGLLEFFYKEAPAGMKSLSTSFTWLSLSFGYFLSSIFVDVINAVTKRIAPSKQGWLHGIDINENNVHLFYWFLAILSCINFANYLYWASWYKYKTDEPASKIQLKPLNQIPLINGDPSTQDSVIKTKI
ncbi:protein NRT1/ PTR FAMILY 4.5-like [Prunus yedoensis var. nudiflora]|uniref:Protein NRT1/ PTR FAMILY 4.5-like n=1 Tax=Prunus yedoensis var. nudiflora TaxID=2094558 RepID=A0A314YLN6_PRUYE|nr:protein NRT1/ PTR FAMILY 4.5-like [Prunus yedoensis var. nudiflora]